MTKLLKILVIQEKHNKMWTSFRINFKIKLKKIEKKWLNRFLRHKLSIKWEKRNKKLIIIFTGFNAIKCFYFSNWANKINKEKINRWLWKNNLADRKKSSNSINNIFVKNEEINKQFLWETKYWSKRSKRQLILKRYHRQFINMGFLNIWF